MQIDEEDYENHLKNKGEVVEKIVKILNYFKKTF